MEVGKVAGAVVRGRMLRVSCEGQLRRSIELGRHAWICCSAADSQQVVSPSCMQAVYK